MHMGAPARCIQLMRFSWIQMCRPTTLHNQITCTPLSFCRPVTEESRLLLYLVQCFWQRVSIHCNKFCTESTLKVLLEQNLQPSWHPLYKCKRGTSKNYTFFIQTTNTLDVHHKRRLFFFISAFLVPIITRRNNIDHINAKVTDSICKLRRQIWEQRGIKGPLSSSENSVGAQLHTQSELAAKNNP